MDLTALTLAQINTLMVEGGYPQTILTAEFIGANASDESQYTVTYFSTARNENVTNHVFVDLDLQEDVRLIMADLEDGDLNLRVSTEVSMDRETT